MNAVLEHVKVVLRIALAVVSLAACLYVAIRYPELAGVVLVLAAIAREVMRCRAIKLSDTVPT